MNETNRPAERWDFRAGKFPVKPASGVEGLQLGGGLVPYTNLCALPKPHGIRGAIQCGVVNDHWHAIRAVLVVEFNQISVAFQRELERGQRVLRRKRSAAAMTDDERAFARQQPQNWRGCFAGS